QRSRPVLPRHAPITPQVLGAPPRRLAPCQQAATGAPVPLPQAGTGRATRRGQGCASWCSLLLGELQALLPLEAEFLDRKDDLTWPDGGRPEASDDVARLHAIEFAVGDVTQHRHAPRRVARVVVDAHELEIREERPDVARPEQREER